MRNTLRNVRGDISGDLLRLEMANKTGITFAIQIDLIRTEEIFSRLQR